MSSLYLLGVVRFCAKVVYFFLDSALCNREFFMSFLIAGKKHAFVVFRFLGFRNRAMKNIRATG